MNTLFNTLVATTLISSISLIGVFILFFKKDILNKIVIFLVALSAGAIIGGALLHLLPEAIINVGIDEKQISNIFVWLIIGFCSFFVLEQFLGWHHCHKHSKGDHCSKSSLPTLILISDGIHNAIDGIIIAASFIVSIPTGIASTVAVLLHEIPQEIGDFGVLIYGGMSRKKALIFNFISALMAILGGIIGYFIFNKIEPSLPYVLAFMAGHFIYISASDLIPEIKEGYKKGPKSSFIHFLVFITGITLMFILKFVE
uniref:ZIP family metal transporter n=1 Tax=candidate division CPR3 bacterium TaxID=2268181 RepID=A0A7C4M2J0_UNCC3